MPTHFVERVIHRAKSVAIKVPTVRPRNRPTATACREGTYFLGAKSVFLFWSRGTFLVVSERFLINFRTLFARFGSCDGRYRCLLFVWCLAKKKGGFVIDTGDKTVGLNINHAARRGQFRFSRSFKDGRFKVGLNPVVTYGPLRKRRVDFSTLVPPYRPLLSESGLPR